MRKTKLSAVVMDLFETSPTPLSVRSILDSLQKQALNPNKTTLYRMLDRFCDAGKIQAVEMPNGVRLYEKKSTNHSHLQCTNCDNIECLKEISLNAFLPQIQQQIPQKKLKTMQVSFSGLCQNCH